MDCQQSFPFGEWELVQGGDDLNPRVADENVDSPESRDDGGHAGIDVRFARDVHGNGNGPLSGAIQLVGCRMGCRRVEIGDGHLCARLGKRPGDLLADAAGCAGHDGDFVFEVHTKSSDQSGRAAQLFEEDRRRAESTRGPQRVVRDVADTLPALSNI